MGRVDQHLCQASPLEISFAVRRSAFACALRRSVRTPPTVCALAVITQTRDFPQT
jgi:hypothetical protein